MVFDVLAIRSTIEIVKQSKAEKKTLIVFNMIKPNTSLTEEIKNQLSEYNIKVAQTMISDLVVFSRSALHNGVSINTKSISEFFNSGNLSGGRTGTGEKFLKSDRDP
jgi:chromosome partitioning protein